MDSEKPAVGLFYFSGTGNTERVAIRLGHALEGRGHAIRLFHIEEIMKREREVDYSSFGLIGIGHPVLGFGATGLVERFTRSLPPGGGRPAFVFKTASSPHTINHGASAAVIRSLRANGYAPFHDSIIAMPCNFFFRYDDRFNKQLDLASIPAVERIAEEITERIPRELRIPRALSQLLRLVNKAEEGYGAGYWARGLKVDGGCNGCGLCVRDCPAENIDRGPDGIRFGSACIWCMRCIYSCPKQAIHASRLPSSVVRPYTGGPALDILAKDSTNDGHYVTEQSRGYYKHFMPYLYPKRNE